MKKLIALILLAALAMSICACSPVNSAPAALLWAESDAALTPSSLINTMDRAMYIENIKYSYYGAKGDAAKQLQQAEEALTAGCGMLMVEPVGPAAAQQFIDLAKAKDVPVLFFGKAVDAEVLNTYDKCYIVQTNEDSLAEKRNEMLVKYLEDEKNVKKVDRNEDGKISILSKTASPVTLELSKECAAVEFVEADTPRWSSPTTKSPPARSCFSCRQKNSTPTS